MTHEAEREWWWGGVGVVLVTAAGVGGEGAGDWLPTVSQPD